MQTRAGRSLCSGLVALVVTAAAAGCGTTRQPVSQDATPADGWVDWASDITTPTVDLPQQNDFFGLKPCAKTCPAPGSHICLSGRVYYLPSLAARRAGLTTHAAPLDSTDSAKLDVLNPLDFVASPTTAKPLASATIDGDGCFVATNVVVPFAGFFALTVDDDPAAKNDRWVFTATGETPSPGKNSEGLEIAAIAKTDAAAWTKEIGVDPVAAGAMILVYRDKQGRAVPGVTPMLQGKSWPNWNDNPATGAPYQLYFFDKAPHTPPYFDTTASVTTASGMVLVIQAQVLGFSGKKGTYTVQSGLGGSSPGTLFVRSFTVHK